MRLLLVCSVLLLGLGAAPRADDGDLASLAHQLATLKEAPQVNEERLVGPALTPIKQGLRAWVERQLPAQRYDDVDGVAHPLTSEDLAPVAARMNAALDASGLTCGDERTPTYRCATPSDADADFRGHIEDVRLGFLDNDRYLLVVTGVGVSCGFDESAYVYEQRADKAWHLLLASEQDDYANGRYKAQHLIAVNVSPASVGWNDVAPPPLVSTLGYSPWCSSNWQMLYTRLWRASVKTPTPAPLLDRHDSLFTGGDFVAAAHLTNDDYLLQYIDRSIDGDRFTRPHVFHYRVVAGDRLERIAPVALDPVSFVDEWLTSDWAQARRWNERPADDAALVRLHPPAPKSDEDIVSGSFDDSLRRCRTNPTLWQVAATLGPEDDRSRPPIYFQVRWMPPYRFTLVAAGRRAFTGCDEKVDMPDDIGTLFPLQGWRADQS